MSTNPANAAAKVPPVPRPSASLVIVNERNEILLVQRNPKASAFGGMHVFPGGNFDKAQDTSLAMTAIRETFEESGLLLASPKSPSSSTSTALSESALDEARFAIHQQKRSFPQFLEESGLKINEDKLLPFTTWITPVGPPKRFQTQFYVTFLPASSASGFSSGAKQERLPTPDGGQEVISARFIHPAEALAQSQSGAMNVMPPQYYIIATLASILNDSKNSLSQRTEVERLSKGAFGRMIINPVAKGKDGQGRTILTYEGDELRGGPKGRLHRAAVDFGKAGPQKIELFRNFDIFTEAEANLTSKL